MANELIKVGAHKLARNECFQYVLDMNIIHIKRPVSGGRTYQLMDRTLHHIQCLLGRAKCSACLGIQADPDMQLKTSLEEALQALQVSHAAQAKGRVLAVECVLLQVTLTPNCVCHDQSEQIACRSCESSDNHTSHEYSRFNDLLQFDDTCFDNSSCERESAEATTAIL
jgi:hypothetical protein